MVSITEEAAAVLAQTAEANQLPEGQCLRLVPADQGLGLATGTPEATDELLKHEETTVLAVPADVSASLGDALIEIRETEQGPQLTISTHQG